MIRCMDLSGEKEFRGAMSVMCCLMVANEAGWKILESSRRVTRRVLEGGTGCESGGMEERSRERGDLDRFADKERGEEAVEVGGEFAERFRVWIGEGGCR